MNIYINFLFRHTAPFMRCGLKKKFCVRENSFSFCPFLMLVFFAVLRLRLQECFSMRFHVFRVAEKTRNEKKHTHNPNDW
jgi:hypothetical protein